MSDASKPAEAFLVFALKPGRILEEAILRAKAKTLSLAGEQTYLNHPPHLTLYVAAFDDRELIAARCESLLATWVPPTLEVSGWHCFPGDVLTGGQTLVCAIAPDCEQRLRGYQQSLLAAIAAKRNVERSAERYRPHFAALSPTRQQAVEAFGYPFVGADWIPHLTIASIAASQWDTVWQALCDEPPRGAFTCGHLAIYELSEDHPCPFKELPIG